MSKSIAGSLALTFFVLAGCGSSTTAASGSGAGSSGGSGSTVIRCNTPATKQCNIATFTGSGASMVASLTTTACKQGGGTVVSTCPTSGLVGCCTPPPSKTAGDEVEVCYYSGTVADMTASCKQSGGNWSTSQ